MTMSTNHFVTVINRFCNNHYGPVVRVKDVGNGVVEVDVETDFHIEIGHDHPATYSVPGHEAKGRYTVDSKQFTER
jgi:hypothetical protein